MPTAVAERCSTCDEYFNSDGGAWTICVVCRVKGAHPGARPAHDARAAGR